MEDKIKELILLYDGLISKLYIYLKYKLTPLDKINSAIPKKCSILDVGSGNGMYSIYLYIKSNKRKILGVDNDKKRVAYANKIAENMANVNFRILDLNKNYSLPRYDVYLINDVLHHLPDRGKIKLLKKIYLKMPRMGILVIKDMHTKNKIKFLLNYLNDKIMTLNKKLFFISERKLIEALRGIGFKVEYEEIRGYLFSHIIYLCTK